MIMIDTSKCISTDFSIISSSIFLTVTHNCIIVLHFFVYKCITTLQDIDILYKGRKFILKLVLGRFNSMICLTKESI